MGENLWGRPKSPVNQRAYGPGQHGQRRKQKVSDFGLQLRAKQKLKGYYGNITEKQFSRTYEEAARRKGNTSENLIALLESRLDAVVYRAKFVPTPFAARQFVNHGHVLVNGKRVNIASFRVKAGDVVSVRERSRTETTSPGNKGAHSQVSPSPGTGRSALSGEDGAELGGGILRVLISDSSAVHSSREAMPGAS